MPRKSKSAISRTQNLQSSTKKQSSVTIEDVEDEGEVPYNLSPSNSDPTTPRELEDYSLEAEEKTITGTTIRVGYLDDLEEEPLSDLMSDPEIPDQDSDLDVDSDNEEITEVSDLEKFTNVLAEAQRVAVEAEDEKLKEYKHPKHYLGNSARTKRHHRQIGRELEAKGYRSVKEWFAKQNESFVSEDHSHNAKADSDEVPGSDSDSDVKGSPEIGLDGMVGDNGDPRDIQVDLVRFNKVRG